MLPSKKAETTLYAELIRRGLPADYARRTAEELDDHRADLLADLKASNAIDPIAIANERLGETRQLAKKIARDYQRRSWFGRHPIATFVLAPIPLLILAAILLDLTLIVVAYPLNGLFHGGFEGLSAWTRLVLQTSLIVLVYALMFALLPSLVSRALARLAMRVTRRRSWAIAASFLIAIAAASLTYKMDLAMEQGSSYLYLNTPAFSTSGFDAVTPLLHYLRPLALAQLSGPLLACFVVLHRDHRQRAALLAQPADGDRLRLAA